MIRRKLLALISCIFVFVLCTAMLVSCSGAQCAMPTNVAVDATLSVSWDSVEGADRYMLSFNGDTKNQFMTASTTVKITEVVEITNTLKSGQTNSVSVRAVKVQDVSGKLIPTNMSQWTAQVQFEYTRKVSTVSNLTYDSTTYSIKWRKLTESNVTYILGVREVGTQQYTDYDLSGYDIKPNNITGNITLDISDILSQLDTKQYEVALKATAVGYEESDYSNAVIVDLTSGVPEGPDLPPTGDNTTLYFYNADGWDNVYAYAWYSVFEQPPTPQTGDFVIKGIDGDWTTGLKMEKMPTVATGYIYVGLQLDSAQVIKVNQLGSDVWSIGVGVSEVSFSYDKDGNIVLPSGKYTIEYYTDSGNINIKKYNPSHGPQTGSTDTIVTAEWAGDLMTAVDGQDGWYSITLPNNSAQYIIFNNGTSGTQTQTLVIDYNNPYYKQGVWNSGF